MTEPEKLLFDFHSKREVAENFSLEELIYFARQRNLHEWLAENFYAGDARKVAAAINDNSTDAELKLLLCKIFNLSPEILSAEDLEEISAVVEKNQRREIFVQKIPGDDRKFAFVENHGELVKALKDGVQLIYLCGGEFAIPLNRHDVTYVGCDNAVVTLDDDLDIDLDAPGIVLENLQVVLRHSINLHAENSRNIKIVDASKKFLNAIPLKDMLEILRGKKSFESATDFKTRAENLRGVAVGETLLDDTDYDFDAARFEFLPQWNFDYISVLKNFAGKNFSVNISPAAAENLYGNERHLQIFADFTAVDGKLTIARLYFDTKTSGVVEISVAARDENFVGSSSIFGLGYGLEIITAYEDWDG